MAPVRRIINARSVTDFLQTVLDQDWSSATIIVCATRDSFIEQLLATVQLQSAEMAGNHHLLSKSLGLLSRSHKVKTVFCPTLEHLRAYLAVGLQSQTSNAEGKQNSRSLLAILNPLSLHLPTGEFSAQGLSRTLSSAVEVSHRANMTILLCECQDALDPTNVQRGEALWYVDVPLAGNSMRAGTEGSGWTGRTVPVKRVVERWFYLENSTTETTIS
ncbi:hypothetical protein BJY01DRAFT_78599 [Aspergillus pseudoustus]|uniref:Elongator complex protein 5 n=1 Tax=Aspergillus pseudoustus TaxID=1810923 RepID=A0ABR4KLW8_9EURO